MKKCRNILALVLSLCLMLTLTPLTALADPVVVAEGALTNTITWRVTDDGVLTISGTGAMPDYTNSSASYGSAPYYPYRNDCTKLVIEEGVTRIGAHNFFGYSNFTGDLVIPDSVIRIGQAAFFRCTGFNGSLTLGSHLEQISLEVFSNCGFTGELVIPDSVQSIGNFAFSSCSGFNKLTLGSANSQLSYIDGAFSGCTGFAGELVIPDSVKTIGTSAFSSCRGFTSLKLGTANSQLQTIGDSAFSHNNFTGDLVIPDSVKTIGPAAFSWCRALNGSLTLGSSNSHLQTIGRMAFQYCDKLTGDIIIPDTVTEIGSQAFSNCSALNGTLTLGGENSHLQTIGATAFYQCSRLTGDLKIPKSVTNIGAGAFYQCVNLNGVLIIGGENSQLQTIGNNAFYQCRYLTGDLAIPDSVTSIGDSAFYQCYGLTGALTLGGEGSQLQTIGNQAFCSCTGLNGALTVGSSVQTVGNEAFKGCSNLTGKLTIQNPETVIGTCAFHGCAKNGDILAFFADHPEFIEVTQTAYTAPTISSEGSETLKVCCADEVHTTESEKLIKTFTRSVSYIYINTITPTPAEVTLAIGKTAQIGTTVTPLEAMDPNVTFSSDNTDVVTVDNTGMLTAVNPGTATVTIVPADGSDHATATVTVTVYDLTVPEKVVVSVDGTASAAAAVNPDTAVTPACTYTSSDENIFTVDTDGNITPIAAGTANVTVTDGEITKTIPVTVADITASADKTTLAKDETADITVTALPDGTAAVQNITFVSSDETVLAVSDTGVVTALKTGYANITVTATLLAAGETVTVNKTLAFSAYTPVTSITATAEKTLLDMEDAPYTQITVEALPEEADNRNVIYTSSDPSVLDVDADGLVIALHEGTATVTVTAADGYGAETTLEFTVTHDLYALRVGPTVEEEESGEATVETNTVRRFAIRYSSSDPEILEVDPDTGAFTAKKKGTVTVTAELDFEDGGHRTLTQEIVVRDPHEGEFRCSRCDWYDDVKDAAGIRGIVYWMIHTITHFVELINSMT